MTAPCPPGTASDPPGGWGLAGDGPARRPGMTAPRPPGTASDPPGGAGLAWDGPARRPGVTAPCPPGPSGDPPGGSGLAWDGPARRPLNTAPRFSTSGPSSHPHALVDELQRVRLLHVHARGHRTGGGHRVVDAGPLRIAHRPQPARLHVGRFEDRVLL